MLFILFIAQRLFIIPAGNQSHIPYTRVNHNKYMVTDKVAYVGELLLGFYSCVNSNVMKC